MTTSFVSIIMPVKNEGDHVKKTVESLFSTKTLYRFEVIIVDDGSTDHCSDFISSYKYKSKINLIKTDSIGPANARNLGASYASGEYIIFCDAHLQFEHYWLDQLIEPIKKGITDVVTPAIADMANVNSIGYGQTLTEQLKTKWNDKEDDLFETAIVPGGCFAISKKVFEDVGGFESGFKTWGHEDVELSIKLWLFGYRCHVNPNVTIQHFFRKSHPYKVSRYHIDYNFLTIAFLHFNKERIEKCKQLLRYKYTKRIESQLIKDGVLRKREQYEKKRQFDDDWYFQKFRIPF